jgi:hypothetical protein
MAYHTNLVLHDPPAEDLQRPIILPFGFPVYDNCPCWICLGKAIIELLFRAIGMLVILLSPFLRGRGLLVLYGSNGRGVAHRVFRGGMCGSE